MIINATFNMLKFIWTDKQIIKNSIYMSKLEKLYSIIENSRDVGVKLPKSVLQQVEELEEA